jgi:acetyltransferase-like isoleucine patch superfamily enzyme
MIPDIIIIGVAGTAMNLYEQMTDARERFDYPVNRISAVIDTLPEGFSNPLVEIAGTLADIPLLLKEKKNRFIFLLHKPEKLNERYLLAQGLGIPEERWFTFIHPGSYVSPTAETGSGCVVLSNSTIQAGVQLGNMNVVNSSVTIEHGTVAGDFNFFAAGCIIGADVTIGDCNFLGLGSSVRERTVIGNNLFAGMGSLILENCSETKVKGHPAKPF